MARQRIHSVCYCKYHLFPVNMRYGGRRWRYGVLAHMMYCPVCRKKRYFVYINGIIHQLTRTRVA
jgi:hypothetical protein